VALSETQLTDIQADLGIGSDEAVFTDAELNRLYARADSGYELAVAMAVRQLMINAARFNDYTAGHNQESKSQVFAQLKEMYEFWLAEAGGPAPLTAGTIEQDLIEPYSVTEYSS